MMNKFGQKYQCKLPLQVKTLFFIFLQNGGKKLNNPVGKIAIGLKKHFNLMFSVQFLLFIFLRAHFSFSTPLPEFIFFKIIVGTLFALGILRGKALGSYVCRVYAAEPPSTAAATPPAAAEEAKSKHLQSPTYLTNIVNHHHASIWFFNTTDKE